MRSSVVLLLVCLAGSIWQNTAFSKDDPELPRTREEFQELERLAIEESDPDAQWKLAMALYTGLPGIQEQDRDQGAFWLEKAAESGSPDARAVVARAVLWNPSSEKEFREKVLGWLREGRDQGDSDSVLILSEAFAAGLVPGRTEENALQVLLGSQDLPAVANQLGEVYFRGWLGQTIDYERAMQFFRIAAEGGYPEGIKNVGKLYYLGRGVARDGAKAREYWERAAALGNLHAIYDMGLLYAHGFGVEKDLEEAVRWYRKASDKGHRTARELLANCYEFGNGVEKDPVRALELYLSLIAPGSNAAMFAAARIYEHGKGTEKDLARAFELHQSAAQADYLPSIIKLGIYYRDGTGTPADPAAALACFEKAAAAGSSEAKYLVGKLHETGALGEVNMEEAVKWFQAAIELDQEALRHRPSVLVAGEIESRAYHALAIRYFKGEGVEKDVAKAVELAEAGVELGDANCMRFLGWLYEAGEEVPKDMALSLRYWEQAADAGSTYAMFHLGTYSMTYTKDHAKTLQYFLRAREAGHAEACFRLGFMYEKGWGCEPDAEKAEEAYREAHDRGFSYEEQAKSRKRAGY